MTTPPQFPSPTEFVYFRLKSSVKPEEAGTNRQGEQFLDLLHEVTLHAGHLSSAWGRTEEDTNNVVWAIEWADSSDSVPVDRLEPFVDADKNDGDDGAKVISFFVTLNPPISSTASLTKNPVTELVSLAISSEIKPDEHRKWHDDLVRFRSSLLEKLSPDDIKAQSWSMGHIERPATFDHPESPSGKAMVYFMAIGWQAKEKHMAATKTKEFGDTIVPIREKMLTPLKGLEMRHVSFKKV